MVVLLRKTLILLNISGEERREKRESVALLRKALILSLCGIAAKYHISQSSNFHFCVFVRLGRKPSRKLCKQVCQPVYSVLHIRSVSTEKALVKASAFSMKSPIAGLIKE